MAEHGCQPHRHNRYSEHYDGRIEITKETSAWRLERCRVCGAVFIQMYCDCDRDLLDDRDDEWNAKWELSPIWMA